MKVWVTSITYRVRYIVRVSIITIFIDRSLSPNHFCFHFRISLVDKPVKALDLCWCEEFAGMWFEYTVISNYMLHLFTGMFFSLVTFSFVPSFSLPHLDELGFQMVKHSGFCNADELTNVHKLFIEKHCVLKMERKYLTFIFHFFDFKRCGFIGLLLLKLQIVKPSGFCDAEELTNVHKWLVGLWS